MGILFALLAMTSWGLGDFLIQKNTRKFGDWVTMFFITIFGAIILTPFVWHKLPSLFSSTHLFEFGILLSVSVLMLISGLVEFQALKIGKISVIEPIFTTEVLVTIPLSMFILRESISWQQILLICLLTAGVILVSIKTPTKTLKEKILEFFGKRKKVLERGVILAIFASALMGCVNFAVGVGARETSALVVNWFFNIFIASVCFIFLAARGGLKEIATDFKKSKKLILSMVFFDNLAWLAYAASATYIPIAIATGLSESYIILAAFLGFNLNREKLSNHQIIGLGLAVVTAIFLALSL